jgi:DNA modification methylase
MELNKIHATDCIDFMQSLPDSCIDLIIADPPYFEIFSDFDYVWNDVNEYISWCKLWLCGTKRILKDTGSIYMWGKIGYGKGFALMKIADWIETSNLFTIVNWITQRNTRGRGVKRGYIDAREELLFMVNSSTYTWNNSYTSIPSNRKDLGANGKPRKNKFKRCTDVWIDISEASQSSKQRFKDITGKSFPTVKSLKLCDRIIQASSNPGDLVYIPFAGSGSEIISCITLNRNWIATEKNETFINEIITSRIYQLLNSPL